MDRIETVQQNMIRQIFEEHGETVPQKYRQQTLTQNYNRSQ